MKWNSFGHSRESGNPVESRAAWIPAFAGMTAKAGGWSSRVPSSAEEGQAMAQPAPGWCEPVYENFQPDVRARKSLVATTRLNTASITQTTPVPLRDTAPPDLRRGVREHPASA